MGGGDGNNDNVVRCNIHKAKMPDLEQSVNIYWRIQNRIKSYSVYVILDPKGWDVFLNKKWQTYIIKNNNKRQLIA